MYTLSSWRSYLGIVVVDLSHQESTGTVGDPFTAYVPGEVTQVSRMTDVPPKSWGSHLGIVAVDLSHQEYPRVMLDPPAINKSPNFRPESTRNPR